MRLAQTVLAALALIGLSTAGLARPGNPDSVLWVDVCGQPGMRVAIDLGGGEQPQDRRDCAEACHAAMCRKTIDMIKKGDGRGATV